MKLIRRKYISISEVISLSYIFNRRERKSCLRRVFNSKFVSFARLHSRCMTCIQALLELKIRPSYNPVCPCPDIPCLVDQDDNTEEHW